MSPYLLLQALWVIAPLISATESNRFLQEFFVTKELKEKVYLLSRQDRPINKEVSKDICHQNGGYLAKLDGGMEEFQHLTSAVQQSYLHGHGFLIDEVGKDIKSRHNFFRNLMGETCTFIRQLSTFSATNYFAVFERASCHYSAKFICEVPLSQSAIGLKNLLQTFRMSTSNQDKMYLFSKEKKPFNFTEAMDTCQQHGGYLLRLKDRAELSLVSRLIKELITPKHKDLFYTSGNRRRDHETYVWGDSVKPIDMPGGIPWGKSEPRGSWECMGIWLSRRLTYNLGIWDCNGKHSGFYVCEVDLQP